MTMTRFERWSVWLTTAGTLITGVVYWWMKEFVTPADPFAVVNHPLQPWLLKAHILLAPLQVFSVGLITSRHVWRHFRMGVKKGRRSGLVAAVTFITLVATGYGLQVVTAEFLLRVLAWSHLALGVIYSLGVAAHWPATRSEAPEAAGAAGTTDATTATSTGSVGTTPPSAALGGSRAPGHDRRRRRDTGPRRSQVRK